MKFFLVALFMASVMAVPITRDARPSAPTSVLRKGSSAATLGVSRAAQATSATASSLPKASASSVSSKGKKGKPTSVKGSSTAKASGPAATKSATTAGNKAKASGKSAASPAAPATAKNATASAAAENNAAKNTAVTSGASSAKNSTYTATSGSSSNSTCDPSAAPSSDQVANAIRDWLTDVATVNTFLENLATDSSDAATVLTFAKNEPKDLAVLGGLCGLSNQYNEAVQDLQNVFGQVITNLQDIINGGEAVVAGKNINQVRCCNVLPDLDVLWLQAAEAEGLVGEVNTIVPRPSTCAALTCS